MKLTIPTNWDFRLIEKIKRDSVEEVYGKLAKDIVGGGRISFILPIVSKREVAAYVKMVHDYNLKFNYLLNSTCLGNMEWSRKGQRAINRLLDWLEEINVDSVTVSSPYLLQLIKYRYPHFKVCISTQVGISSLKEAQYWEELGADTITLSVHKVNRNFQLLKLMKKNLKCRIQLIANLHCLKNCPFWLYHGTSSSHSSQSGALGRRLMIDYSFIMCSFIRLMDPIEFIRSEWIRPEDIHFYEEIGIDRIKLVNRTMPSETIIRIVEAYTKERYDGNLLDLFSDTSKALILKKSSFLQKIKYILHPFSVNVFKLIKGRELLDKIGIYVDQRSLDGFIQHFMKEGDCNLISCKSCRYCDEIAKKAIKIQDINLYNNLVKKYEKFLDYLISGKMWG